MRGARLLLAALAAFAVGACARQQPAYNAVDPDTAQPQIAAPGGSALYSSSPAYAQQSYAEQPYAPQTEPRSVRGLTNSRQRAPQTYAQQPYAAPPQGGPYVAAPDDYASVPADVPQVYTLDSGDKLRVVVFGQDGITNSYMVDAGGNISLPLIGSVPARGSSTQQLAQKITARLKQGYVREPHVSVEIEVYRPFFILGEVTNPGQYPYVANMTAETAVAIAGGFAPRAAKTTVELTRNAPGQRMHGEVPLGFSLRPGDTILVKERWF
jgi:polysaccharide export outer membrane protein